MKAAWKKPGAETLVELTPDGVLHTRTMTVIPDAFLTRLHERGCETGRAPMGDSHGAWQKAGEFPLALALEKIPPDQWEDPKAWEKLLNDPDFRKFRCDGGRTF